MVTAALENRAETFNQIWTTEELIKRFEAAQSDQLTGRLSRQQSDAAKLAVVSQLTSQGSALSTFLSDTISDVQNRAGIVSSRTVDLSAPNRVSKINSNLLLANLIAAETTPLEEAQKALDLLKPNTDSTLEDLRIYANQLEVVAKIEAKIQTKANLLELNQSIAEAKSIVRKLEKIDSPTVAQTNTLAELKSSIEKAQTFRERILRLKEGINPGVLATGTESAATAKALGSSLSNSAELAKNAAGNGRLTAATTSTTTRVIGAGRGLPLPELTRSISFPGSGK